MMKINNRLFFCLARAITVSIFSLYSVMSYAVPARGSTTKVNVNGTLVSSPDCVINNNASVRVDFGDDVFIKLIDGISYKKKRITYDLKCSLLKNNISVSIRGQNEASFGRGLIATSIPGLGIQLYHSNKTIASGEKVNFIYGQGIPELYAVLAVKDPDSMKTSTFNAMASMVIDYQ